MADSFIQLSPDSTGKRVDTRTAPDGDHREVQVIGSPTTAEVAEADLANGLDVDVTRIIPGTAATNLGKAVDSAAGATDSGVAALVLRDDALAALTPADGDYTQLRTDSTGALWVRDTAGATGGTAMTDDAAFTPGTTSGTPAFAFADETAPDSVDEGDAGALRMTLDRKLLTRVVGATDANRLDIDGSGHAQVDIAATSVTVPISAAALPLPTGAATLAGQTQPGVDIGDVTVNNAAGASAVNVQDGGNSLTVDGTVAVSGAVDTELPAAAALADNTANPTAPAVGAFQELWDGATWDRAPGNSTDGALVNLGANNDVSLNAGTNNIGDVDVLTLPALPAGTNNIGDVDVLSVIPGTGATNLGKAVDSVPGATDTGVVPLAVRDDALATLTPADGDYTQLRTDSTGALWIRDVGGGGTQYAEDTAHVSGDLVNMAGVVQQAADAALSSDGDRSLLQVDASGFLKVNIKAGAGSGGTAMTDDAAFTPAVTNGTPAFGFADETAPDSVDEGDAGALRMTLDRKLLTRVVGATDANRLDIDGSGHAQIDIAAASVTVPVSAASLPLPTGASTLAEQQTQTTHLATIAGDTTDIEAAVELIDDTVATLGTSTYTEATTKGLVVGAVRRDADTTLVDTTNEVSPLQVDANGRLKVEAFSGETLPVSLTSTTITGAVDTELPAAAALADNAANPTAPAVGSFGMLFDGSTWDRALGNSTDGALVNLGANNDVSLNAGSNNIGDVDVLTLPALVAGSANIGDVDIASVAAGTVMEVVGDVAADAAVPANPVIIGARASTAQPTAVSADGDSVNLWANRKGAPIVSMAPHVGLIGDPWTLTSVTAQYTTTQTSAVLLAGGGSERIVVTKIGIQAGGTTAGTLQVYFGTGAYSRGTSLAIFDGEFAPSATLKPGVRDTGPFISATNGDDVLVTTSAAINPLTITIWYYILT